LVCLHLLCFPECKKNADIAFILDASGSVREENFVKTKDFVKSLVDSVNVDRLGSNVAIVTFSNSARVEFHLGDFNNRIEMIRAIDAIPYSRGTTNTAEALKLLRTEVFQTRNGDRGDLRNVGILLTDGGSNDFSETLKVCTSDTVIHKYVFVCTLLLLINICL
jgi:collagen type VI alpha